MSVNFYDLHEVTSQKIGFFHSHSRQNLKPHTLPALWQYTRIRLVDMAISLKFETDLGLQILSHLIKGSAYKVITTEVYKDRRENR
jgi:hypothetical protein